MKSSESFFVTARVKAIDLQKDISGEASLDCVRRWRRKEVEMMVDTEKKMELEALSMFDLKSTTAKELFHACNVYGHVVDSFIPTKRAKNDATLDFHTDKRIAWVETEGIPFKLWTDNSFKRIAARWGELLSVDDQEDSCFHSKRLCVHTRYTRSISEDFKIIHRGKVHWIRAKETPGWVPDFEEENEEEDIDDANSNEDADRKSLNFYEEEDDIEEVQLNSIGDEKEDSNDTESSLSHPPGFSHVEGHEHNQGQDGNNIYSEGDVIGLNKHNTVPIHMKPKDEATDSVSSGHFKKSEAPRSGGSILELLNDVVKVGQVMGYKMEGCMKNMAEIIEAQGVEEVFR
ncbi:hypothetical protein Tco_0657892 [Tanacetum coccineum]